MAFLDQIKHLEKRMQVHREYFESIKSIFDQMSLILTHKLPN